MWLWSWSRDWDCFSSALVSTLGQSTLSWCWWFTPFQTQTHEYLWRLVACSGQQVAQWDATQAASQGHCSRLASPSNRPGQPWMLLLRSRSCTKSTTSGVKTDESWGKNPIPVIMRSPSSNLDCMQSSCTSPNPERTEKHLSNPCAP